jgi:hypothetical protein
MVTNNECIHPLPLSGSYQHIIIHSLSIQWSSIHHPFTLSLYLSLNLTITDASSSIHFFSLSTTSHQCIHHPSIQSLVGLSCEWMNSPGYMGYNRYIDY